MDKKRIIYIAILGFILGIIMYYVPYMIPILHSLGSGNAEIIIRFVFSYTIGLPITLAFYLSAILGCKSQGCLLYRFIITPILYSLFAIGIFYFIEYIKTKKKRKD